MDWINHFQPGQPGTPAPLTLLLLHSTGGHERQLLQLGQAVAPGANLLGVRGRSLEEGFPRYFRRFSATDYDQPHLISETDALADFLAQAAAHHAFDPARVVALGYSNGANIGLTLALRHPGLLAGAALIRPVMPLDEPPQAGGPDAPDLRGLQTLLLHGSHDPYAPHGQSVGPLLRGLGAATTERRINAGHELTDQDVQVLQGWFAEHFAAPAPQGVTP